MALRTSRDSPHPPPTSSSSTPLLLHPHNVSVMSYQEFEQLPPLSEECTELPAMWEDGGALDSGREGYSVGGSFDDDPHWGPSPHDSSVQLFADSTSGSGSSGGGGVGGSSSSQTSEIHHSSLEQRSEVIEQTLSEIYASPFPQLMYAAAQHPSPATSTNNNPHHHHHPRPSRKKKTSFQTPDPTTATTVDSSLKSRGPQENDNGRIPQESGLSSPNEEEAEAEEMVEKRGERAEMFRLDDYDTHGTVKASIARAAKKAVSGYRSCDDADRYVGAQVKPTLILARAPPSPSGILRRTNKKTAAKVMQGSVRWADGKAPSLPPTDDVA